MRLGIHLGRAHLATAEAKKEARRDEKWARDV